MAPFNEREKRQATDYSRCPEQGQYWDTGYNRCYPCGFCTDWEIDNHPTIVIKECRDKNQGCPRGHPYFCAVRRNQPEPKQDTTSKYCKPNAETSTSTQVITTRADNASTAHVLPNHTAPFSHSPDHQNNVTNIAAGTGTGAVLLIAAICFGLFCGNKYRTQRYRKITDDGIGHNSLDTPSSGCTDSGFDTFIDEQCDETEVALRQSERDDEFVASVGASSQMGRLSNLQDGKAENIAGHILDSTDSGQGISIDTGVCTDIKMSRLPNRLVVKGNATEVTADYQSSRTSEPPEEDNTDGHILDSTDSGLGISIDTGVCTEIKMSRLPNRLVVKGNATEVTADYQSSRTSEPPEEDNTDDNSIHNLSSSSSSENTLLDGYTQQGKETLKSSVDLSIESKFGNMASKIKKNEDEIMQTKNDNAQHREEMDEKFIKLDKQVSQLCLSLPAVTSSIVPTLTSFWGNSKLRLIIACKTEVHNDDHPCTISITYQNTIIYSKELDKTPMGHCINKEFQSGCSYHVSVCIRQPRGTDDIILKCNVLVENNMCQMTLGEMINKIDMLTLKEMTIRCDPNSTFMRMFAEVLGVGNEYLQHIEHYKHPGRCLVFMEIIEKGSEQPVGVLCNCLLTCKLYDVLKYLSPEHDCKCCDVVYRTALLQVKQRDCAYSA